MKKAFKWIMLIFWTLGVFGVGLFSGYVLGFNANLTPEVKNETITKQPSYIYYPVPTNLPTPVPINLSGDILFTLVNNYRSQIGKTQFLYDPNVCQIATKRLPQVKINWSHDGFREAVPQDTGSYGENLSRNYTTETQVLNAWIKSPSHNKNLIADYTQACIVCDGTYCVQELRSDDYVP